MERIDYMRLMKDYIDNAFQGTRWKLWASNRFCLTLG